MPSPQYYLEVKNPELASLNTAVSTVTGTEYGYTEIILKDRSILSHSLATRRYCFTVLYLSLCLHLYYLRACDLLLAIKFTSWS